MPAVSTLLAAPSLALTILAGAGFVDAPTSPQTILGGDIVGACGWPNVVSIAGSCSGTLIHPQVVLYAAHCGDQVPWIRFADTIEGASREVIPERCETHPIGSFGFGTDFAYCVLPEAVTDVPITPPLMGCDVDAKLAVGEPATIVGFGQSDDPDEPYGIKRYVTAEITGLSWNEVFVGDEKKGACYGDSGGPVLTQLDDGTWRVFGVTSWGKPGCGAGNYFSLVHEGVDWIETASGIDVTPCHDSLGNWDPSPACGGFAVGDPGVAEGSWDTCSWAEVSGPSETCGAAFDPTADDTPPVVVIADPGDGERYNSAAGDVSIAVAVDVEDVGWGAERVIMRVVDDGEVLFEAEDIAAPFVFPPLSFATGVWTLEAEAIDRAGNVGYSEPVTFGVNTDPPAPAESTTGDGTTGDGTTGDGTTGASGTTDAGGTTDGEGDDGGEATGASAVDDDSGCGCRSDGSKGGGALSGLLFLLGLGALRRRRRGRGPALAAAGALALGGCGDDGIASDSATTTTGATTSEETSTTGSSTAATEATGATAAETATSTGENTTGALCGNGHIDGDELCDDGNVVDGDGCNADCTPSGAELWRQPIAGPDNAGINAMRLDAAGDVIVAGFAGPVSAENAGWLAKFTVDGELLWEHTQPAPEGSNTGYRDVAVADGRIVAVGWEEGDFADSTIHVYDGDGSWQSGATIAVDPDNDLFSSVALAGELAVVMSRYGADGSVKVIAYDAALEPAWEYTPAIEARGGALARSPDGTTLAAFGEWTSPETQGLHVVSLSDAGAEVWSRSHGDPLTRYYPYRLAVDDSGDAVICGELARTEASDTLLFAVAGDDGAARWKERFPVPGPGYDWCSAVTFTDDGAVAFAGSAFTQSAGWDAWVGKVDAATGEERWIRSFGGEGSVSDRGEALVGLAGGELLVGGVMSDEGKRVRTLLRLAP